MTITVKNNNIFIIINAVIVVVAAAVTKDTSPFLSPPSSLLPDGPGKEGHGDADRQFDGKSASQSAVGDMSTGLYVLREEHPGGVGKREDSRSRAQLEDGR